MAYGNEIGVIMTTARFASPELKESYGIQPASDRSGARIGLARVELPLVDAAAVVDAAGHSLLRQVRAGASSS
jgi:hypothetical protein